MKKFIIKGSLFAAIIISVCVCILFLSAREPARTFLAGWTDSMDFMDQNEMLLFFKNVKEQDGTTRLIIGDSICRQMLSGLKEYNPGTSIQAANAALMITGQYLLAEQYLRSHPDAADIFLVMHPLTLTRTFDTEWGYRHAAMTYAQTDTLKLLDANTIDAMKSVYGAFFLRKDVVRLIEDSPVCRKLYLSYINVNAEDYVQSSSFEITDQYIKKMYDLCESNGVTLHLYSSPVSEHYREQMAELEAEYAATWMNTRYPDYFNDIFYYPDEWTEDMSHFSGEYAQREQLDEVLKRAYADTEFLENVHLGRTE